MRNHFCPLPVVPVGVGPGLVRRVRSLVCGGIALAILSGCSTTMPRGEVRHEQVAVRELRAARNKHASAEERAAHYLAAAAETAPHSGAQPTRDDLAIYNAATGELTKLLRSADGGRLWGHPITLADQGTVRVLRFAPGIHDRVWAPDAFTAFELSSSIRMGIVRHRNVRDGVGGALVGVRKQTPPAPFSPPRGITAPVTAVLDFQGRNATLTLCDPTFEATAKTGGAPRPLAADFSAPLAYYRQFNEFWVGFMGAVNARHVLGGGGLYLLEPYDPDRIPLLFVHGLISTPEMWRNVINELEADPGLRGRFQCWVFGYPTGLPVAYSALQLRQALEKAHSLHYLQRPMVIVGHSMGGLVAQMQVTTLERKDWDVIGPQKAKEFFDRVATDAVVQQSLIYKANPQVARVVFMSTPHRGSELAIGLVGRLATRIITLPGDLVGQLGTSFSSAVTIFSGGTHILPNSVTSLSPSNPTLKALDQAPIYPPFHSIIGDRGHGGHLDKTRPQSSDGVVPYWSSHMNAALSEIVVPGPHGLCEMPQSLAELRRILHEHLRNPSGRVRTGKVPQLPPH